MRSTLVNSHSGLAEEPVVEAAVEAESRTLAGKEDSALLASLEWLTRSTNVEPHSEAPAF